MNSYVAFSTGRHERKVGEPQFQAQPIIETQAGQWKLRDGNNPLGVLN